MDETPEDGDKRYKTISASVKKTSTAKTIKKKTRSNIWNNNQDVLVMIEKNNFTMEAKTQKLIEEQSNSLLKKLVNVNVTEP